VILHDGIKTIQNGDFQFSSKKNNKTLFPFKKPKKHVSLDKKTHVGCFFFKKKVFFSTLVRTEDAISSVKQVSFQCLAISLQHARL